MFAGNLTTHRRAGDWLRWDDQPVKLASLFQDAGHLVRPFLSGVHGQESCMRLLPVFMFMMVSVFTLDSWPHSIRPFSCEAKEPPKHRPTNGSLLNMGEGRSSPENTSETVNPPSEVWSDLIQSTIVAAIPRESVETKHWGETTEVLSRYEFKTKRGRLSVNPRTKTVKHGFWQRYTLSMLDPEKTLQVEFRDVDRVDEGPITVTMQLVMRARVRTEFEYWIYGVKGINGQAVADVSFAANVDCSIELTSETSEGEWLPSVALVPELRDLHLKVRDIDARQIGVVGGWAAEELGDQSRSMVNSILHRYEGTILEDLRRKLMKNQDRLRISPGDLWNEKTKAD